MTPQPRIDELRPQVAAAFEGRASLTTAIPQHVALPAPEWSGVHAVVSTGVHVCLC